MGGKLQDRENMFLEIVLFYALFYPPENKKPNNFCRQRFSKHTFEGFERIDRNLDALSFSIRSFC